MQYFHGLIMYMYFLNEGETPQTILEPQRKHTEEIEWQALEQRGEKLQ